MASSIMFFIRWYWKFEESSTTLSSTLKLKDLSFSCYGWSLFLIFRGTDLKAFFFFFFFFFFCGIPHLTAVVDFYLVFCYVFSGQSEGFV